MNDRTALFANVLDQPADDTARLDLVDWLEEHGEEMLRRFIRAGVVAARFRAGELIDNPDYYAALAEIAAVAATGHPARWRSHSFVSSRTDAGADRRRGRVGADQFFADRAALRASPASPRASLTT